jgi:hypothetical protein
MGRQWAKVAQSGEMRWTTSTSGQREVAGVGRAGHGSVPDQG